jgi:hypothetical protein
MQFKSRNKTCVFHVLFHFPRCTAGVTRDSRGICYLTSGVNDFISENVCSNPENTDKKLHSHIFCEILI